MGVLEDEEGMFIANYRLSMAKTVLRTWELGAI